MASKKSNIKKITIPRGSNHDTLKKKSITISQLPKFPDQDTSSGSEASDQSEKKNK
jgi:hypothetical protein